MRLPLFCECGDLSHHVVFEYDSEENELTIRPRLNTHTGFWGRFVVGLRYILGLRPSRYGEYDVVIITPGDARKLANFLEEIRYGSEYDRTIFRSFIERPGSSSGVV